jgi:hypothetical protein
LEKLHNPKMNSFAFMVLQAKATRNPLIDQLLNELELPFTHEYGYQVSFPGTSYGLSIQVDHMTTGGAFCETALMQSDDICYEDAVNYTDFLPRWRDIKELKEHLLFLMNKVKDLPSVEQRAMMRREDLSDQDDQS